MKVIKRDGSKVDFDQKKIISAIRRAWSDLDEDVSSACEKAIVECEKKGRDLAVEEIQDIIDVGATERIDALRIVAHHAHHLTLFCQLIHDCLLGEIRVLILVDQHEVKLIHVFPADSLVVLK